MGLGWFSDSCALGSNFLVVHMYGERKRRRHTHIYIYIYIHIYRYADMYTYMYMYGVFRASAHSYMKACFHSYLVHSLVVDSSIRLLIHCLVDWCMHSCTDSLMNSIDKHGIRSTTFQLHGINSFHKTVWQKTVLMFVRWGSDLLPMLWEGGWEYARLIFAFDSVNLTPPQPSPA